MRPFLFALKRAEQPVPYYKNASVVPVEIFKIRPMVYPVVRRRVQKIFEGAWKLPDRFGVYPELIDQAHLLHEQYPYRMKPIRGIHAQKRKDPVALPVQVCLNAAARL